MPHLTGERQIYAAMLTALDDGVGRLLARVKELGLERNTIVVFFSDNGGAIPVKPSKNWPLRGGKNSVWEGGIRVPFIISWPGHLPAGTRYTKPVSTLDILPTVLTAAGMNTAGEPSIEGVNLLPYLTGARSGEEAPHGRLFWRKRGAWAVRDGRWKLVETGVRRRLFDIEADISEGHDVARMHPETVRQLVRAYHQWNASNAARIPWSQ